MYKSKECAKRPAGSIVKDDKFLFHEMCSQMHISEWTQITPHIFILSYFIYLFILFLRLSRGEGSMSFCLLQLLYCWEKFVKNEVLQKKKEDRVSVS